MLTHQPHYLSIDFHHHHAFHSRMLQNPSQHTAITGTDDQYALCRAMLDKRHMDDHLLIDKLICLGNLHDTVKQKHPSMRQALENHNFLIRASNTGYLTNYAETLSPTWV